MFIPVCQNANRHYPLEGDFEQRSTLMPCAGSQKRL